MPALTQQQLREFKNTLETRREALREEIHTELMAQEEDSYAELAGRVRDMGDESIADVLSDSNLALIKKQLDEMKDIEAALLRINDLSYGSCIDCAEDIELKRLEAYPTAQRCLACQEHHDKTYAHGGTPSI
jgi:RNA polymerase-binding transcription factor DksA